MTKQLFGGTGDYVDGTGRYQTEYQQLWNDLVPESRHCETTAGQLINRRLEVVVRPQADNPQDQARIAWGKYLRVLRDH
jgi:hypothetical protein